MQQLTKWQKARIKRAPYMPYHVGKCIWVWNHRPLLHLDENGMNRYGGMRIGGLVMNNPREDMTEYGAIDIDDIELMPEFSDEIETIPFEVWSKPEWPGV